MGNFGEKFFLKKRFGGGKKWELMNEFISKKLKKGFP
ncbi:MAG: hypothetical protein CM15mP124_3080 [Alphaproteobacteria bacterium]|nr:MAG: hypothetical protein CM15mP124_3080 [Alphaproteobacteria bacterium]